MYTRVADLKAWATERIEARHQLPTLVRRLVLTTTQVAEIEFHADEETQYPGWDGKARAIHQSPFVPTGWSGWELGTSLKVDQKADKDYAERKQNTDGLAPRLTAFVFVTPRAWPRKKSWIASKRKEKFWRTVRAYDAGDLVTWVEQSPAVDAWLARIIGARPAGITDLDHWWEGWRMSTAPILTSSFMLARDPACSDELLSLLNGAPVVKAVQGDSRDDAIAYIAAMLSDPAKLNSELHLARAVIVESSQAWESLSLEASPLILIPTFADRTRVAEAASHGHHVLIPISKAERDPSALVIPPLDATTCAQALAQLGISPPDSDHLAVIATRSLTAMRRLQATSAGVLTPPWASGQDAMTLVPIALCGAWDTSKPGDVAVLDLIAHGNRQALESLLRRLLAEPDSPAVHIGLSWSLTSHEDAWQQLSPLVSERDLSAFAEAAQIVLGEVDPRFGLPPAERWRAAIYDKTLRHSEDLRRGVAETVALLGSQSNEIKTADPGFEFAHRIVRKVLDPAADWTTWASIGRYLPLLAEGSPEEFLRAVDRITTGDHPLAEALFASEAGTAPFVDANQDGLVWALETLAWNPGHFTKCAVLLARLSRIDPGFSVGTRPISALVGLFLPWYPSTGAPLDQRLKAIDVIRRDESNVAWELLSRLLPAPMGIALPAATPAYRSWADGRPTAVTRGELIDAVNAVVARLLNDSGSDPERWDQLIRGLENLPNTDFNSVADAIEVIDPDSMSPEGRKQIWSQLREMVARHTRFDTARWAMPAERVARIRRLADRFEPTEELSKIDWLFSVQAQLPERSSADWRDHERSLAYARTAAVERIFGAGGVPALLELARAAKDPWLVGLHTSAIQLETTEFLENTLNSPEPAIQSLGLAYAQASADRLGHGWVDRILADNKTAAWPPISRARLLITLPIGKQSWTLVEAQSSAVQAEYWRQIRIAGHGKLEPDIANRMWKELGAHGRWADAVRFAVFYEDTGTEAAFESLEAVAQGRTNRNLSDLVSDIGQLLARVAGDPDADRDRLAKLEWVFLPILYEPLYKPTALPAFVARDASFFIEALAMLYGKDQKSAQEIGVTPENRTRALHLFEMNDISPGITEAGVVDGSQLRSWVNAARIEAEAVGLKDRADLYIGEFLATLPAGSDGVWPHEAVRELLESVKSEALESGLRAGMQDRRGMTTRGALEGGAQERDLASQFDRFAAALQDTWLRAAIVARDLAADYRRWGRREDDYAQRRG